MSSPEIVAALRAAGCVFAEDEATLLAAAAAGPAELAAMVARRVAGTPLEQVLGWAEFCGQRMTVEAGVFVPRRRTGFLVQLAAELLGPGAVVLDLCCGVGAVGAALLAGTGRIALHAVDIDPAAVRCARRNVAAAGGGSVYEGDLYAPLPARLRGHVDVIVANAPYVPTDEIAFMPPEARLFEHRVALDGGADGLDVQRRLSGDARHWLAPGGTLLIETGAHQAAATRELLSRSGLVARVAHSAELAGTVALGNRPG